MEVIGFLLWFAADSPYKSRSGQLSGVQFVVIYWNYNNLYELWGKGTSVECLVKQ